MNPKYNQLIKAKTGAGTSYTNVHPFETGELNVTRKEDTMQIQVAIEILRAKGFTNRMILMNVNNDSFLFEDEEVNKILQFLQKECITFNDEDFDKLVGILYNL